MTFALKRLEKEPWHILVIVALGACVVWLAFDRQPRDHGILWVWLPILIVQWCVRQRRYMKTPDLSLEIGPEDMRLQPREYWGIDAIPFESIKGMREEGAALWIYYDRNGAEKAIELARNLFSPNQWEELIRILRKRKESRLDSGV